MCKVLPGGQITMEHLEIQDYITERYCPVCDRITSHIAVTSFKEGKDGGVEDWEELFRCLRCLKLLKLVVEEVKE